MVRRLLTIVALLVTSTAVVHAQSELIQGGLDLDVEVGYSDFGLPIANSSVGREWASGTDLYWQIAHNYSTVPVRVDFEHRMPSAFRGRIEVISTVPFAPEEYRGELTETIAQDILVPPSSPRSFMFAPRICPASAPGMPVDLRVKVYKDGISQPILDMDASVYQLEPAHLYSLRLDGPMDESGWPTLVKDRINDQNQLGLSMSTGRTIPDSIYSSDHWIISVDHRQVTSLPTAARDFAFVIADARQIINWPDEDQDGLLRYILAGGHACLFGSQNINWRGLQSDPVRPLGRGVLVNTPGDFETAKDLTRHWIEGELTELMLWIGGAVFDQMLDETLLTGGKFSKLPLVSQFSLNENKEEIISHRPGFLHPVWIYREICRSATVEPWDSAEYLLFDQFSWKSNRKLSGVVSKLDSPAFPNLGHCAQPSRFVPAMYWISSTGLVLLTALVAGYRRSRIPLMVFTAVIAAAGILLSIRIDPPAPQPVSLELLDMDVSSNLVMRRSIVATAADVDGQLQFELPPAAVLRHVSWSHPGDWNLESTDTGLNWTSVSPGSQLTVTADSSVAGRVQIPVELEVSRISGDRIRISVDTSALRADQQAFLYTVYGWHVLDGATDSTVIEIPASVQPQLPGISRLQDWTNLIDRWSNVRRRSRQDTDEDPFNLGPETIALFTNLQNRRAVNPLNKPVLTPESALTGILLAPQELRGSLSDQGLLITPMPVKSADQARPTMLSYARITFPIGRQQ